MRPLRTRLERVLPPPGEDRALVVNLAAAVALVVAAAGLGPLALNPVPDPGLGFTFGAGARTADELQRDGLHQLHLLLATVSALAVGVALLNVTLLAMGKAATLRHSVTVRTALGASPWAIVREHVSRMVRLLVAAAVAGTVLGLVGAATLRSTWPAGGASEGLWWEAAPGLAAALVGMGVLGALSAVPLATAARRIDLRSRLGGGARVMERYPAGLRWLLPVAQLAMSLALLLSSGLLIASATGSSAPGAFASVEGSIAHVDLGSRSASDRASRVRAMLAMAGTGEATAVAVSPGSLFGLGVEAQAMSECGRCYVGGLPVPLKGAVVRHHVVSPDTFRTLGIAVVAGREFTADDDATATPVALVNRAFARRGFENADPVGRSVRIGTGLESWFEVVGVVDDHVLAPAIGGADRPAVFLSMLQHPPQRLDILVLGDEERPVLGPGTEEALSTYVLRHVSPFRWIAMVLLMLGVLTLLLATLGLRAVITLLVSRRRREIALRMAVGASRGAVMRLVAGDCLRVLLIGAVAGLWLTTFLIPRLQGLAPNTTEFDPVLIASLVAALLLVGLSGSVGVVHQATRQEPSSVLAE